MLIIFCTEMDIINNIQVWSVIMKSTTPLQGSGVVDPRAVAKCRQACVWLVAYVRINVYGVKDTNEICKCK